MADVEATVWHDLDGNITAVGRVVGDRKRKVEPVAAEGRRVLPLTIDEEQLSTLHLTHVVDVKAARLLSRAKRDAS